MIIAALLIVGGFFSALFSGSETGFFRASRLRLLGETLHGSALARRLLWLVDRPSFFVGTALLGNNIANYGISFAMVLFARQWLPHYEGIELAVTFASTPFLFLYGELLPKQMFFDAPNRLLKLTGPIFLVCFVLFLPATSLVFAMAWLLERIFGRDPQNVRKQIASLELERAIVEGHELGVLRRVQRDLASHLLAVVNQPAASVCVPVQRMVSIPLGMPTAEVQRLARRHRWTEAPVLDERRQFIGYIRVVDLVLSGDERVDRKRLRPLPAVPDGYTYVKAVSELQNARADMGRVVDGNGKTIGFLQLEALTRPLLKLDA
ncbi:MAG TPA: CNNM domain-containing protein [Pirellulaceae bacterium]|nr:CNNM domain-containing protein [Pirellulaceae bacterium]